MPHPHAEHAFRPVRVHIITVSTSRTQATDRSGPLLRALVEEHQHIVAGHTLVPDDPDAIGDVLDRQLAIPEVEALIFTGGTGISARDCTPAVVRARLDRELTGFGELFRMLSFQQIGAAAMLSTAVGGIARGRPVFALPGSTGACELAMRQLILPELSHLVLELSKEAPLTKATPARTGTTEVKPTESPASPLKPAPTTLPAPGEKPRVGLQTTEKDVPELPAGLSVVQTPSPSERPPEPELGTGWRAALRAMEGRIERGGLGEIPASLERIRAVMDVLESAGERAEVVIKGQTWTAFGFPDLHRNASKVLLVREGEPLAEIVALHRWPTQVGLCAEGGALLPGADLDPGPMAEARGLGRYDGPGFLFALEGGSIYLLHNKKVAMWDGRRLSAWEPQSSMLATLLLHWSQR